MPREARKISGMNIYHIMLRGVNRQCIFEDNSDRRCFLEILRKVKEKSEFRLHAFCLMDNHVHLLIEPAGESLETIFKRIGCSYAPWFNRRYQRIGHLFQDRFRSEAVETEQYFITVLRYILQNPMKAGLEKAPGRYPWSSYLAYEKGIGSITDTEYALKFFTSRDELIGFVRQDNEDTALEDTDYDWRIRDDQAKEIISRVTKCDAASEFQQLAPAIRKEYAVELYRAGLSMGQIARLTGISKATVSRAVRMDTSDVGFAEPTAVFCESNAFEYDDEEIW